MMPMVDFTGINQYQSEVQSTPLQTLYASHRDHPSDQQPYYHLSFITATMARKYGSPTFITMYEKIPDPKLGTNIGSLS